MYTEVFVFSIKTENNIEDIKNLEDMIDFGNLDKNHDLFSNKNKKVTGKFEKETPKTTWIDDINRLISKRPFHINVEMI